MKIDKFSKRFLLITLVFAGIFVSSCGDQKNCARIETGFVNISIYPDGTEYQNLNTVGGWEYITAEDPSMGILVYRTSLYEFKAYERTSPYDQDNPDARIYVDEETEMLAIDSVNDCRYLLLDGYPFDGPGSCPLTEYSTSYNGLTLRIYYY